MRSTTNGFLFLLYEKEQKLSTYSPGRSTITYLKVPIEKHANLTRQLP